MPSAIDIDAQRVAAELSAGELHAPAGERVAFVCGETLRFPYRTYYVPSVLHATTARHQGEAKAMCLCLGTRHYDGQIREASLRELDVSEHRWSIPFAVQLLGEYVVEIASLVETTIEKAGLQSYVDFARDNLDFMAITKRRAVSYWDCYYRHAYKNIHDFPNYRVICSLEDAARAA